MMLNKMWSRLGDHRYSIIRNYSCEYGGVNEDPVLHSDGTPKQGGDGQPAIARSGYVKGLDKKGGATPLAVLPMEFDLAFSPLNLYSCVR